ncbi:methionine aminopeptidase [Colletotrichum tofieldiae]|nr:methionine aminopeptidase [Colletotrichum tofieldiae]
MGSKTPEDQIPGGNGGPLSNSPSSSGGEPRGAHLARDGDASLGDQGDDDDDNDNDVGSRPLTSAGDGPKKKKKKPKKKKNKSAAAKQQSSPPRVPLSDLFPSGEYPAGEYLAYNKGPPSNSGMGFPTGLCLNNETAHYTPNPGQKDVVLQYGDVMKVDYGVQVNGWIVDSAFTMSFDPTYDNLLAAARDATNSGIKAAGIDVRICDVSAEIQEAMESYEVEIRGKTYPVRAVRNICAHDIKRYRIHGGKSIPFIRNNDQTKMEEGEIFAIETFGTTGRGKLYDDVSAVLHSRLTLWTDLAGVYGYGLQHDAPAQVRLPFASANRLYKTIKEQFGSIVFCRRYLDRLGLDRYLAGLNCLVSNGVLESYAPLADIKGSYSSQFEHTILLRESSKEIMSRGSDY